MNKKTLKKLGLLLMVTSLLVVLSACARVDYTAMKPPSDPFMGTIYRFIGHPLQNVMLSVAESMKSSNGAGWAIALITFVVRIILLPLMLNQSLKSTRQQEKMKVLQPQLKLVQEAVRKPGITQAQQVQINQLSMKVYKENNMSMMGGMGCLPLILQLPIMMGIYQAVVYSKDLFQASFFGIALGNPSMILTMVATLLYLAQGYMMTIGVPADQKKMMRTTMMMSPLMTFFISFSAPAALALYFLVGGIIAIIQQTIVTFIIMPKVKRDVDRELTETPMKEVVTEATIAEILNQPVNNGTSTGTSVANNAAQTEGPETTSAENKNRQRNAGKQQHRKD